MKFQAQYVVLRVVVFLLFLSCNPAFSQTPASTVNWKTTRHGRHFTLRINPDADLSRYGAISVGAVAYTGPARKLKSKDADKLVSLLQTSLTKDLTTAKLSSDPSATSSLVLNADITKVKRSHPIVNVITTAAVFVPLDLGDANMTAHIVDMKTGQEVAEIETVGCGQIYQVWPSFQPLGQSKLLLKKESRSIAKELSRMSWNTSTAGVAGQ